VTPEERRTALETVAAEVRGCTRCRLHQGRTEAVPGEGDPETEVVFVGEGPGFNEDRQGRPFVGAAGNVLKELLTAIGWRRQDVFITNVVKCRPPENRDPEPDEIAACAPYLRRQLEILDPAVVVTLGRHSLGTFMPGARIGSAHGTQRPVDPATGAADATAYAMYHPAAALRQGGLRQTMLEDMCALPEVLLRAREQRADRSQPAPAAPAPEARARHAVAPDSTQASLSVPQAQPVAALPQSAPGLAAPSPSAGLEAPLEPVAVAAPTFDPDNQMELF